MAARNLNSNIVNQGVNMLLNTMLAGAKRIDSGRFQIILPRCFVNGTAANGNQAFANFSRSVNNFRWFRGHFTTFVFRGVWQRHIRVTTKRLQMIQLGTGNINPNSILSPSGFHAPFYRRLPNGQSNSFSAKRSGTRSNRQPRFQRK